MTIRLSLWNALITSCSSVPYVKGMHHRHHRSLDPPCGAAGVWPHRDGRSKPIDGVVWHRLRSGGTHKHQSQEETCIRSDDRCDLHSAVMKYTNTMQGFWCTRPNHRTKQPPRQLTRAVYPVESRRLGSVPFWTKNWTLSKSPFIAADQIPAGRNNTQQCIQPSSISRRISH